MGAALASNAGSYRLSQTAEINVTPFVDVMLVLLIIFMVAIPATTVSVKVDLPSASAGDQGRRPVVVSLTTSGSIYVGDRATTLQDLPAVAGASLGPNASAQRLHLRADEGVSYGDLMRVMDRLRTAGFDKVGLVADAA